MVALNENLSHCEVSASKRTPSLDVIEGCDFTKRSGEVHGGPVVNFGVSGFCGLFDASPLRRRCAAPLNKNDPETQLYYVRNRTYSPALGRWTQRDPIGYQGGANLYQYVNSSPLEDKVDSQGLMSGGFIAGMGTFAVAARGQKSGDTKWAEAFVQVWFYPAASLMNKNQCKCTEICLVQMVQSCFYLGRFGYCHAWAIDHSSFCFRGGSWWENRFVGTKLVTGKYALTQDFPEPSWYDLDVFGTVVQNFKSYAVCMDGKEKGASFGYLAFTIDWSISFWLGQFIVWNPSAWPDTGALVTGGPGKEIYNTFGPSQGIIPLPGSPG